MADNDTKAAKAPKVLTPKQEALAVLAKGKHKDCFGPKGKFLPGHDAKLKSRLVTAAREGDTEAVSTLRTLGWEKFIPKAEATGAAGKAKASNGTKASTAKSTRTKAAAGK